ncbi:hypothetical protein NEOC65_000935 [Neochlamydia sp. AcF65]|nr:hypothetical protein [Neochlamydia sp. AcF65]
MFLLDLALQKIFYIVRAFAYEMEQANFRGAVHILAKIKDIIQCLKKIE